MKIVYVKFTHTHTDTHNVPGSALGKKTSSTASKARLRNLLLK